MVDLVSSEVTSESIIKLKKELKLKKNEDENFQITACYRLQITTFLLIFVDFFFFFETFDY